MAVENFALRSDDEIRLLLVHHPLRVGNLHARHGGREGSHDDERLTKLGQWEAMNLGFAIGQCVTLLTHQQRANELPGAWLFDLAAATQGRTQEAAIWARRAAHEVVRSMGVRGLSHTTVVPNWRGINLGGRMAGLTEPEIAERYPHFAYEWLLWRQGVRELPPDLPEPDSEAPQVFANRVLSGLRFIIQHRKSRLIAAIASRSVLQISRSILQGNNPLERTMFIDPPYGWVEEWAIYSDRPPVSLTGEFVSPVELSATYAARYGWPHRQVPQE